MLSRLKSALFPETDSRQLGLFRFLYCATVAVSVATELRAASTYDTLLRHPELFYPIRLFALLGVPQLAAGSFRLLQAALVAALVLAAAGFWTRRMLAFATAFFFLFYGTIYSVVLPQSVNMQGHQTSPVFFVLLIMLAAPHVGGWGVDAWRARLQAPGVVAGWPLQAVKVLLVMIYFGAAYCRLSPPSVWADGDSFQGFILEKLLLRPDGPRALMSLWVAQQHGLCGALSVLGTIFEASFVLILFFPRLTWFYVAGGITLHLGSWVLFDFNYLDYFGATYLVFFVGPLLSALDALLPPARTPSASLPSQPARRTSRLSLAFVCAFIAVNAACIVGRLNAWPLASWNFACGKKHYSTVRAYLVRGVFPGGDARWLQSWEIAASTIELSNTIAQAEARRRRDWVKATVDAVAARIHGIRSVVLVKRTVRKNDDGRFEFVDEPVYESVAGADTGHRPEPD